MFFILGEEKKSYVERMFGQIARRNPFCSITIIKYMGTTMSLTFFDIVEALRKLPLDDKSELRELLDHELIAARRSEIDASHAETMAEYSHGELKPTSDVNEIIRRLRADDRSFAE